MSTAISSHTFPAELYTSTIVFYTILLIPTIFIWRKHGRHGFLAYNYIYGFCALRIAGAALSIAALSNPDLETAAQIVNSMAISPLLLAGLGLLHEGRRACVADLDTKREWVLVGGFHGFVTLAVVLLVVGVVDAMKGLSRLSNSTLVRFGLAVLVICYVVLVVWTALSLKMPRRQKQTTFVDGSLLLSAVLFALPFIGMRLAYGVISFLLVDPAFASSLAVKIVLSFVPELLATALFVFAGFRTRDMYVLHQKNEFVEYSAI